MGRLTTATAAGMLLLSAPAAQAGMTTPRVVSPPGLAVQEQAVAAGGGRTALLMTGLTNVRAKRGQAAVYARVGHDPTLGRTVRLAARRGGSPTVAVGADGTAVAAWTEHGIGVRATIAPPGKPFGPVRTLRPSLPTGGLDRGFTIGGIVVAPSGRAVITWRTAETVQVAIAPPLGRFQRAAAIGTARYFDPSIALGFAGTVVIGWLDTPAAPQPNQPPPGPGVVRAATLSEATSSMSTPVDLANINYWPAGVSAAGGPAGALIKWWESGSLRIARVGLTRAIATPITAPGSTVEAATGLATDAAGDAVFVTRSVTLAGGDDLETVTAGTVGASVAPVDGVFGPVQRLSTVGWIAEAPQVGAMPDRTLVAWEERQAKTRGRVQVAFRRAGGVWTALRARTIAVPEDGRSSSVRVGADAHHAPVTWITYAGVKDPSIGGRLALSVYRP